jgi:hypothetical protein
MWIAGRYVARHARCRTAGCAAAWRKRLERSFGALEREGACLTRDDATAVGEIVRAFETRLAVMLRRRDRPCARLFVAATARAAGALIRSQRPVWPPQDRRFSDEWHGAFRRFDRDRVAAKELLGCRSVILGPKLTAPADLVHRALVRALLPPEAATGMVVDLPAGWHLYEVAPGSATFATFVEYGHGGFVPEGGRDLRVYVTDRPVAEWLRIGGEAESVDRATVAGADAIRVMRNFQEDGMRRLDVLVPRGPMSVGLAFGWYADDPAAPQHFDDAERMIRSARFFPPDDAMARARPASPPVAGPAPAPR